MWPCRERPLLLVGNLTLQSKSSEVALLLRDEEAAMPCVLTEACGEGQRAVFNTAWIGSTRTHTRTRRIS